MVFAIPEWEDESSKKNAVFSVKTKVGKPQNGSPKISPQKKLITNRSKLGKVNGISHMSKIIKKKNKKQLKRPIQKENKKTDSNISKDKVSIVNPQIPKENKKTDINISKEKVAIVNPQIPKENKKTDINISTEKVAIVNPQIPKNILPNSGNKKSGKLNVTSEQSKTKDRSIKKTRNVRKVKNLKKDNSSSSLKVANLDTDKLDEVLLNAKKKKFNEFLERDDIEDELFKEDKRKIKFKKILKAEHTRNTINFNRNKLRERMLDRLKSAQFRFLNEKLYTSSGSEASQLFQNDPVAFQNYHEGYQQQVKKWPVNPLDVIVKRIKKMPKSHLIADMGCGEAALAKRIPHTVRSFDLVAAAPGVEVCDMAHTPLLAASVDAVVYCLALMGTELTKYLVEANRVLKMGGHLLIAEVESRFTDVNAFTKEVSRLGFKLLKLDSQHEVFFFMEFVKNQQPPVKKSKLPMLTLKPCIYKRR